MWRLKEAFKQMQRRGLIAKRECYSVKYGVEALSRIARRLHEERRESCGFVHIGEWDPSPSIQEPRVPLLFGSFLCNKAYYGIAGCVRVGEVVADCLTEQGIQYKWEKAQDCPIWLATQVLVSEVPRHQDQASDQSKVLRVHHKGDFPESTWDEIGGNSVRLLNVAKMRRLTTAAPSLLGPRFRPRVGDKVQLGICVRDAISAAARNEFGDRTIDELQFECGFVEVVSVLGQFPRCVYRGELLKPTVFIDPAKLRRGSSLNFTADHVYPSVSKTLARR